MTTTDQQPDAQPDAQPNALSDLDAEKRAEALAQRLAARRIHRFVFGVLATLVVVAVVVSLAGAGWGWTGLQHNTHLWDWLHLLVLPLVLLLLPLWFRTHERLTGLWRIGFAVVALVMPVLVVGGYRWGWEWTGFADNKLWDWLQLLVLPVSVSLLPLWLSTQNRFKTTHAALAALAGLAFVVLVIGGYVIPWLWTGFEGNTLWDWVDLFLVPFAIPATATVLNLQATWEARAATARLAAAPESEPVAAPEPEAASEPERTPVVEVVDVRGARTGWPEVSR